MPRDAYGRQAHAFLTSVESAGAERRARAAVVIQRAAVERIYRPDGRLAARDRDEALRSLNIGLADGADEVDEVDGADASNDDAASQLRQRIETQHEVVERMRAVAFRPIEWLNTRHLDTLCRDNLISESLLRDIEQFSLAFK